MLAFLGTAPYKKCNYIFSENERYEGIRFVQEAIVSHLCKKWTENDRILVFLTKKAEEKNWHDNGHLDRETKKPQELEGLETRLKNLQLDVPIETMTNIPTGSNTDEIKQIFEQIIRAVDDKDEVYFDITHGFRSLPMLALIALNYLRVRKKITIKGVFYGAFEVIKEKHPGKNIDMIPTEDRNAPIFDLMPFIQLFDWTNATDNFIEYGDARSLQKLISLDTTPLLTISKGKDLYAKNVDICSKMLEVFTKQIRTCRVYDLIYSDYSDVLAEKISNLQQVFYHPLVPLLDPIKTKLSPFRKDHVYNGFAAVEWCIQYNLIQQGITILFESLINIIIMKYYNDKTLLKEKEYRKFISGLIKCKSKSEKSKKPIDDSKIKEQFKQDIPGVLQLMNKAFIGNFESLRNVRNDINHAGLSKLIDDPRDPDTLKRELEEKFSFFKGYFSEYLPKIEKENE
jgi:CRISPR-associated Csx2 family protein